MTPLVFFVNGHKVIETKVNPEWTLVTYLRNKLKLCGTKSGCGQGGCGACTVMMSRYDRIRKKIINKAVNACLIPVCSLHGTAITTVEGIGSINAGLHPVQERIAKSHGTQCGFCTPGMVMSMYTLLRNNAVPPMEDIEKAFEGNLCRCTGYRPILEGYRTLSSECCGASENGNCCQNGMKDCQKTQNENFSLDDNTELFSPFSFKPYDPSQDPIFPPELMASSEYDDKTVIFQDEGLMWYRPVNLEALLELKVLNPEAKIVVGNTNIGIEMKFKNAHFPIFIQATNIPELCKITHEENGIRFGASITLTEMEDVLLEQIKIKEESKTRVFVAITEMFKRFAGKQIRNVASVAGSILTGSDLNPIFLATQCQVEIQSKDGQRYITMDDKFMENDGKFLKPEEIVTSILIPFSSDNEFVSSFKQGKRRTLDTAIVNAGMFVKLQKGTNIVENLRLAFGKTGSTPVLAHNFANTIIGTPWNELVIEKANNGLTKELSFATSDLEDYKNTLILSFFFKFYLTVSVKLNIGEIPSSYKSATELSQRKATQSFQLSQIVPEGQPEYDLVGRPFPHLSGLKQATGEAVYVDDIPKFENELYLAFVTSERAHAKIIAVDASAALKVNGVVKYLSAKDIQDECNVFEDEHVFAKDVVTTAGQIIGAIIGTEKEIAKRSSKLVIIEYENILPLILTIDDAIKHKSFYSDCINEINKGDIDKGFEDSDEIIEGELTIGSQEHFYMETQVTLAVPKLEDGEMEIFCATQHPSGVQELAAKALGLPRNKIVVKTKRLGGGFGGKEAGAAAVAIPVAIAAQQLRRPVRCMLNRDEDMVMTGKRHPFYCQYRVGYNIDGKVVAVKLTMYSNGGHTLEFSGFIMNAALVAADNAYNIPNLHFTGTPCKTNLPSNTAFRGFGGPQGMLCCETVMQHIADKLKMDPVQLRQMNMYNEGDTTPYNRILEHCTLRRCWEECLNNSEYARRKAEVEAFNSENRWKKRGLAVIPTKFGIGFFPSFFNQAGALVLVYKDGSVLISHGGCEMGQGLHTKMIQIASRVLKIPASNIHISETSTDKVPNTSPSAGSTTSDLNGMALLNACQKILERLEPFMKANPNGKWEDWVNAAYFDRVSLSATGFYGTPRIGFDMKTKVGTAYNYFCFGTSCCEVEIDCLTGDHKVRRTDIVMDVGESLNPAVDIGQIEGGYIQGYGLFTLEDLQFSSEGILVTRGPDTYKIPTFDDIPTEFNVSLLRGAPNPKAVFSSKAVGEPSLFLAAAAFFAIKDAIKFAREEIGLTEPYRLDSPATSKRIRSACEDQFTKKC